MWRLNMIDSTENSMVKGRILRGAMECSAGGCGKEATGFHRHN